MRAEKLSLVFSAAGHLFIHLFTAMYFTIALAMEQQGFLNLSYADLTPLWGIGAMLVGLAALPAGWLADRWSSVGMMVIYFFGLGAAGMACALSEGTSLLWIGLTAIGLFAAIYHPVGIPWVVRNAKTRGKALGLNGIFGTAGVAVAGLVAGVLSDSISWRAAFYVPAAISLAFGFALLICWRRGLVSDGDEQRMNDGKAPPSRGEMWRAFFTLTISMTCMGLVFQAMQTAAPKLFELRLGDQLSGVFGSGASGPGMAVALTYTVGGVMQLIGGHLSDRFPQKPIYMFSLFFQAIVVTLIAQMSGFGIIAFAALSAAFSTGALPAESIMLARFSPQKHRSLAFGAKYVLAFGTAPLAIWVASSILQSTGEYVWLFYAMGATALVGAIAAWQLPGDGKEQPVELKAQPAE